LGIVNLGGTDLAVLVSHSGRTKELVDLLPYLRQRARAVVVLTSSGESPLAKVTFLSTFSLQKPPHSGMLIGA
jgi:D-arabinose 5-phosphate isomerase GutQ